MAYAKTGTHERQGRGSALMLTSAVVLGAFGALAVRHLMSGRRSTHYPRCGRRDATRCAIRPAIGTGWTRRWTSPSRQAIRPRPIERLPDDLRSIGSWPPSGGQLLRFWPCPSGPPETRGYTHDNR